MTAPLAVLAGLAAGFTLLGVSAALTAIRFGCRTESNADINDEETP